VVYIVVDVFVWITDEKVLILIGSSVEHTVFLIAKERLINILIRVEFRDLVGLTHISSCQLEYKV